MDLTFSLTILAAALATYGTRTAGYALIKSMETIPPRMEAALTPQPMTERSSAKPSGVPRQNVRSRSTLSRRRT